jgi:DNA polymerase-1
MGKLYLLDAYALIYRAYYALIRAPRFNSKGLNTSAIFGFVNTLEEIRHKSDLTHIGVAFDPAGPTFRHEAYKEYKAQRESTPEDIRKSVPIIKDIIRAYNIPILEVPGFEADDVIGTLATTAETAGMETVMVTPDKDYGQLVTSHISQLKPTTGGLVMMGPEEVKAKYDIESPQQVIDILGLMGDASDNIPGCPGVGEKTAVTLIKNHGTIEGIYEHLNEIKGKLREKIEANREQVMFSKYLVTIRRDVPLDFNPDNLQKKAPDMETLKSIFEDLEFRSLIKKICGETPAVQKNEGDLFAPPVEPVAEKTPVQAVGNVQQLDLFGSNADEGTSGPKYENFKPEKFEGSTAQVCDTKKKTKELIEKILSNKQCAFSLAASTQDAINAEIVGVGIALAPGDTWYVDCDNDPTLLDELRPMFESPDIEKTGHDIKLAMVMLGNYNILLDGPLFDTMLAHYLIQPELKHYLSYIGTIYLHHGGRTLDDYFGTKWEEERDMRFLPDELRAAFTTERADMILRLRPRLEAEMQRMNTEKLFRDIEMPLVPVLARMEQSGVLLDTATLREISKILTRRMLDYEQQVFKLSGHQFNLSSPKQVGDILFGQMHLLEKPKKTKGGQYVTSEPVLEELRAKEPVVDFLLKYRGMKKLLSTYIDTLPMLINRRTGHIHSTFNQAVTATGRLSSSNPNLQNIPVRGDDGREIRRAFIPEPGQLFFSADYSQIELRIMAHLSQDEHLIAAFRAGQDVHAATASKIFGVPVEEVTPEQRRIAKTANFGIMYGISAFGLAQRLQLPRSEAKQIIDGYFATFPAISDFIGKTLASARETGYVETLFGRRRYIPDINAKNGSLRAIAERNAVNAPIQGSSADIIKLAMIRVAARLQERGMRSRMVLQIHDELLFETPPEEVEALQALVVAEMEHVIALSIPLTVECSYGKNWLEAH